MTGPYSARFCWQQNLSEDRMINETCFLKFLTLDPQGGQPLPCHRALFLHEWLRRRLRLRIRHPICRRMMSGHRTQLCRRNRARTSECDQSIRLCRLKLKEIQDHAKLFNKNLNKVYTSVCPASQKFGPSFLLSRMQSTNFWMTYFLDFMLSTPVHKYLGNLNLKFIRVVPTYTPEGFVRMGPGST